MFPAYCLQQIERDLKKTVFQKIEYLWGNVKNYGRDTHIHTTGGFIIRRMWIAFQMTMAKNAHSEYIILLLYYTKRAYVNAPNYYVRHTLPVLFLSFHIPVTTSRSSNLTEHFPSPTNNNHPHTQHPSGSNEIICCCYFFLTNAIKSHKTSVKAVD
jgi:hypothetical protein